MTGTAGPVRIWGLVPAAGISRRMGSPKQTLLYRGSTMVATVARTLLEAGADGVVVVTQTALINAIGLPLDARVRVAVNDGAGSEMIDSIRIGLAALAGPAQARDGVLVVPGDMPGVSRDACRVCMAAFVDDPRRIVIATHSGKRGHPMIFPLALRETVDKLDAGLRDLARLHADRVHLVETGDPGVTQDVDTLEDYERL